MSAGTTSWSRDPKPKSVDFDRLSVGHFEVSEFSLARVIGANGLSMEHPGRGRRAWTWVVWSALLAMGVLVVVGEVVVRQAGPILKGRVVETLSARFDGRVELDRVDVSVLHGLQVSGEGLRIFAPDDAVAAGATTPLIAIRQFGFHAGLLGLFFKPMHVDRVHVAGMAISVPPREIRSRDHGERHRGKMKIVVGEIVCDDSRLVIGTLRPGKEPKSFALQHIEMRDVGPNSPWQYDARIENAIPRGEIHASGAFGPWETDSPGDSAVTGRYTFDHADLNPIKGVGGMLGSEGTFRGQLDRMDVDGTADVPNFSLDTANRPMPLHTRFHAIVDGTSGDTYLQPVQARLGRTDFTCSGAVTNERGVGHTIDLDVRVPNGHLEDFLLLAIRTNPVVMTARIGMKTKLHIPPGKESVTRKLRLRGEFTLRTIHFSNPGVQDKVDMLSLRAQGKPNEAKPGAEDVRSRMEGAYDLSAGRLRFRDLDYAMPGARVALTGVYTLDGSQFDFEGKVRTEAKLSQMVGSWWKSLLLKPVDPFFHKHGAGAEIPIKISGTKGSPKFGLDLFRKEKKQGAE